MTDLPWGDERTSKFSTSVGLITTNGPNGHNIMACEWTHQLSYSPGIISVHIGPNKATAENIIHSKEFGVNLADTGQTVAAHVAGKNSGHKVDKVAVLKELGAVFFKAKKIGAFMLEGAAMQAECKLIATYPMGDHTMFVGEIIELYPANDKEPLVYHNTKYSAPGETIPKPDAEELAKIDQIIAKHLKK